MKEQFLGYEQSVLLKQLGFDELCLTRYAMKSSKLYSNWYDYKNSYDLSTLPNIFLHNFVAAPLWQQVIEWLHRTYNIEFSTSVGYDDNDIPWRSFNIIILEDGPLNSDVLFFEEPIYNKTQTEVIREYCIPKALDILKNFHKSTINKMTREEINTPKDNIN
jgi:hypothetical protein